MTVEGDRTGRRADMRVEIEVPFSNRDAGDIAITAAEGGIGYWSQIERYEWQRWGPTLGHGHPDTSKVLDDPSFVFYTIHADVDDDGTYSGPPLTVTVEVIRRGYKRFLKAGRGLSDPSEPGACDATEADVIVQYGLFGEVVYG